MIGDAERLQCYPHCFCEESLSFGVLFWSSGAYFLSSLLLYLRTKERTPEFEFWIFCTITLATSSFIFHATQTLVTVALDYASIIMILIFFPCWNRFSRLSRRKKELGFYLTYFSLWLIYMQLDQWARIGLSLLIFIVVLVMLKREVRHFRSSKYLLVSVGLGIVSFGAFLLEESRILCDPQSLFQAHGIWHVGSATALYLFGRWRFQHHP